MELLFPYLLCTLPIHTLFAQNSGEISVQDYIMSLFITILVIAGGILGFNFFVHNVYLAELIFCMNFFLLLYANLIFISLFTPYKRSLIKISVTFGLIYILCCLALSKFLVFVSNWVSAAVCAKILFGILVFISFFVYLDIIKKIVSFYRMPQKETEANIKFEKLPSNLPDIYHIISDAHTGFDREEYCDSNFREELIKRGFHIYQKAKSNYNYTYCSLPSLLNMDYIENIAGSISPASTLKYYGNNKVIKVLKSAGYQTYQSTFRLYRHLLNNKKICFELNIIKALLTTSLYFIVKQIRHAVLLYTNLKSIEADLTKILNTKTNAPKYFMGHLLAPHYPYSNKEDGTPISYSNSQNMNYYFTYQKYINKKLLRIIDTIKENMKPNTIILLHGDHSVSGFGDNKFKTLLAVYFPAGYDTHCIDDNCTLVNLFRSLFNEVLKTNYSMLQNRFEALNVQHGIAVFADNDEKSFKEIADINNFDKRLKKLVKKYANKRVLLYGTGDFFKFVNQNYDISGFNIIGFSDIRYDKFKTPYFDEASGYTIISPDSIYKLKPDIVIITTLTDIYVEKYFNEVLFKDKQNRFKYDTLLKQTLKSEIEGLYSKVL